VAEFKLGVVGDLHTHWDEIDVHQFDQSEYDLLYFTGDLGGGTPESTVRVARVISKLKKPALVMPGNNDTIDTAELAAELTHRAGLAALTSMRTEMGAADQSKAEVCGYSTHRFQRGGDLDITFIAARPHSMGGPDLSFPEYMLETYGIGSLAESEARLVSLVDEAESEVLVFLSHNGPTGLGDGHHDPWGADFKPDGGDWGDPDLTVAIDYARQKGKRVLAVIAGHMHLRTKLGTERTWCVEDEGTLYVNAARVPRIFSAEDDVHRHHLSVSIGPAQIGVAEVLVPHGH
jgi:uncharacterized protein (TIGR04168 family)